ncbi:MAG: phosphatase PAP2 family protein [Proteobacteria bacterium]|nr:phosphatase PAP2 family protein [Pseudomonadota bacterium]
MGSCLALVLLPISQASGAEAQDLRLNPWVDIPVVVSSTTFTAVTYFAGEPPWIGPTPIGSPKLGVDARWAGRAKIDGRGPDLASDITALYPSFVAPFAIGLYGLLLPARGDDRWHRKLNRAATFAVVTLEAVTINEGVTHIIKHAIRRPRPYSYSDEWLAEYQEALDRGEHTDCEGQLSFPSGHTSGAGAWAFSVAHTLGITQDWPWYFEMLPYLGALGITTATGVLRIQAHKHFPTDVIVGGVLGATIGLIVPELHRSQRFTPRVTVTDGGTSVIGVASTW